MFKITAMPYFCEPDVFIINGLKASHEDFGYKEDQDPDEDDPYGCGDMQFITIAPTAQVLEKYHIDLDEYYTICEKLKEVLSFGECGQCE